MNPPLLGIAISRRDGSNADGIHLLWTAPPAAGYSVKGFDIQRRISKRKPEIRCYTLTADELQRLHDSYRVETTIARLGVRRARCPEFPQKPPDEPFDGGGLVPPDRSKTCIEFQNFPKGEGPNPRTERGCRFTVRAPTGAPASATRITAMGAFNGLDCGVNLEIILPVNATSVELTLVHFSRPATVEAFEADGSSAGTAVMGSQQGQVQTLGLSGEAINRVIVRAPQDETLLLNFCFASQAARCIDFQSRPDGPEQNPRVEQGVTFEVRGHTGCMSLPFASNFLFTTLQRLSRTEIRTEGKLTGLNCGFELIITLPLKASMIEMMLVHFTEPARVDAFNSEGNSVGAATMTAPRGQAETLRINGKEIQRVVVTAQRNEVLLLKFCYASRGTNLRLIAEREGRVHSAAGDEAVPVASLREPTHRLDVLDLESEWGERAEPAGAQGVAVQPSSFQPVSGLEHSEAERAHALNAMRLSTQVERACIRYDVNLREPHDFVSVTIAVPVALAIAMRGGKAVATKLGTDASGSQTFTFEQRKVEQVLIYTTSPARGITVCVDIPHSPEQEQKEWSSVPFIVKGLQLPLRTVNGALASGQDEENLASSRLLPGEAFDAQAFGDVAALMNEAAADSKAASPVWYTTLTRERKQDNFIELRTWPYALSLLAHAAWRRMLGFGYLDKGGGLTAGEAYDYRITGHFHYRDLDEQLYGFHNIPTGTTLPSTFHLGPLRFNSFIPTTVDLFEAVPEGVLRHTGRKGITLRAHASGGRSLSITFPSPVTRVTLEMEPKADHDLGYEAKTSDYLFGFGGSIFSDIIAPAQRVELTFAQAIDTLTLQGKGFLYGVRVATQPLPAGQSPDDLKQESHIIYNVRYEPTPAPQPPPFLGTLNLQQPIIPGDPAVTTQNPPRSLGFRLVWLPPPAEGGSGPVPWPPDLGAFPPFDVLSFQLERSRVDTGGGFVEVDGQSPPTMFFGNRSSRRDPPQLYYGIDLLEAFPENAPPEPPVPVFMEAEDVLDSAKMREEGQTPPPGSLHRYRIRSVDAIGRLSTTATLGSIVRLEKRVPPPQPVSPSPLPPPAGVDQPSGLRANILQASDPELTAEAVTLLGASTNAVVFEWGWTDEQRRQDPYATEFRVYWQPLPPDVVRGALTGTPSSVGAFYEMAASMERPLAADTMKGRYINAGGYPFKVASHTGGQAITMRFEKSQLNPGATPSAAEFEFHSVLKGDELRPAGWPERFTIVPITSARDYRVIFRDRLTLDATHTRARVWVGVSAADDQPYVTDELPASEPNGGRPGNECSIAAAAAAARYIGRPTFSVPPPLPDVPEQVTDEPVVESVGVRLDLGALLPGVPIPAGHKIKLERVSFDTLTPLIEARDDDTIGATLPDGTTDTYTLANPTDQAKFLAQIRTGTAGRVETRFLMDFLIRYGAHLEKLWQQSQPEAIPFGIVTDTLPNKPERYIHRIRLADQAGHISEGGAILPQVVRVPSLSPPVAPEFELPDSDDETLTVTARVHDSYELKWLGVFALVLEAVDALDERTLEKPQLLRLPNRRDLYPNHGIRLRLRDGSLLAPTTQDVATGTSEVPDLVVTVPLAPGYEKRVAVWVIAITRDGITSRFSGPRIATTGPAPLVAPTLTVTAGAGVDHAAWTALTVRAEVSVERSTDSGASWRRVTPWLAEATTAYDITRTAAGARQYRLALRDNSGQSLNGAVVSLA